MNLTEHAANELLDGTPMPATLWVQLHLGDPGAGGTDNVADDSRRRSFTRVSAAGGAAMNAALIEWLSAPTTEDITHISIWDDDLAGSAWWVGEINDPPAMAVSGQSTEIPIGLLTLSFDLWT